jgi:DNA polymerase III delta prime subunit
MELLNKYTPKSITDIVGNRLQVKKIVDRLKSVDDETCLLGVSGPSGCGKTLICNLIFSELDLSVHEVTKDQHSSVKDLMNSIKLFCTYKTIKDFINPKRKVIFIDNVDILQAHEKTFMSALSDILEIIKANKIFLVLTFKTQDEKRILEWKKDINIIRLSHPPVKDTLIYILGILDKEEYEYDDSEVLDYISKNRGCIRESINNILNSNLSKDEMRIANIFKDLNGFEITKKVLHEKFTWKEIQELLKEDITNVSFLMYENVVDELHTNRDLKTSNKHIVNEYLKIVNNFTFSIQIEDHMFKHMDWSLYYLVNMLRIYGTTNVLDGIPNKPNYKDLKYRYSQLLSKLSHRNILNKKVRNIYENKFDTIDLLYLTDKVLKTSKQKTKSKNKGLTQEEQNLINTYDKYFE